MYGYIKGVVKKITPEHLIIENNDIGYLIKSPTPYDYKIDDLVTLYTYLHVREDIFMLYGFKDETTLNLFLKLIDVKGIGPKSALSIVAYDDTNRIVSAIETGDAKYLTRFPGIGNKSSQQIILDLKGKLAKDDSFDVNINDSSKDVYEALRALGYNQTEIKRAIKNIDTNKDTNEALKDALAYMLK
ncbi:MAG: Holliday junction branch migration protein RuvA [Acholeplasmataceae bacterium]